MSWRERALCSETDPELFFPEGGNRTRAAKAICDRCPVRADCLDYALTTEPATYRYGIWGGLTSRERAEHVRDRQQVAA